MLRRAAASLIPLVLVALLAMLSPAPAAAQVSQPYIAITGTSTLNGPTVVSTGFRGVLVVVQVDSMTGTSITPAIQAKDTTQTGVAKYVQLTANLTAITAKGTYAYVLYPGVGTAAGGVTATASMPLAPLWRVTLTYASITYSSGRVDYYLLAP